MNEIIVNLLVFYLLLRFQCKYKCGFIHVKEKHMITNIIIFLVGAHLGAKYPQKATLVVDTALGLLKSAWAKVSAFVSKK
jgi:hypothetical protein